MKHVIIQFLAKIFLIVAWVLCSSTQAALVEDRCYHVKSQDGAYLAHPSLFSFQNDGSKLLVCVEKDTSERVYVRVENGYLSASNDKVSFIREPYSSGLASYEMGIADDDAMFLKTFHATFLGFDVHKRTLKQFETVPTGDCLLIFEEASLRSNPFLEPFPREIVRTIVNMLSTSSLRDMAAFMNTDRAMRGFNGFTDTVKELDLRSHGRAKVDEAALLKVTQLFPQLTSLKLDFDFPVGNLRSLAALGNLTQLRNLELYGHDGGILSAQNAEILKGFIHLESLVIDNKIINSLDFLAGMHNLQRLHVIVSNGIDTTVFRNLNNLKVLRLIAFTGVYKNLEDFARLEHLETLALGQYRSATHGEYLDDLMVLQPLSTLPSLTDLSLCGDFSDLFPLALFFKHLQTLRLNMWGTFLQGDLNPLLGLTNLRTLVMNRRLYFEGAGMYFIERHRSGALNIVFE